MLSFNLLLLKLYLETFGEDAVSFSSLIGKVHNVLEQMISEANLFLGRSCSPICYPLDLTKVLLIIQSAL